MSSRKVRAAGFTMIEVVIVMAILAIVTVPFLEIASTMYTHFHSLALQADLKAEAETAAGQIFRRAAAGGRISVDGDNHGLAVGAARVRWDGGRLTMREGRSAVPLVAHPVTEFVVVRRNGVLTLNLAVTAPARNHGRDVTFRYIYDYPSVTDLTAASPASSAGRSR